MYRSYIFHLHRCSRGVKVLPGKHWELLFLH